MVRDCTGRYGKYLTVGLLENLLPDGPLDKYNLDFCFCQAYRTKPQPLLDGLSTTCYHESSIWRIFRLSDETAPVAQWIEHLTFTFTSILVITHNGEKLHLIIASLCFLI